MWGFESTLKVQRNTPWGSNTASTPQASPEKRNRLQEQRSAT
jgi:hypothetical protein